MARFLSLLAFTFLLVQVNSEPEPAPEAKPQHPHAHYSEDPCHPSPCGPNTYCSVNSAGAAVCRCNSGFFPKPDTITGCGPQCTYDEDCRSHERCSGNQCTPTCQPNPCDRNADCTAVNHKAICKCYNGFYRDRFNLCIPQAPIARRIMSEPAPLIIRAADPCSPSPCGLNTDCRSSNGRAVCSCLPGHQGDPYTGCRRGECQSNSECPSFKVCENYHCVNPCDRTCGSNSNCDVRNHVPVCTCPVGYTGDPFRHCRVFDENELCQPSPCGENTRCRVENGRPICSCERGYIGNPLAGCRHECDHHSQCPGHMGCIDFKCKNPCSQPDACGQYATCDVRNHFATCKCPADFLGDAYTRCFPECTSHADCPANRACIGNKCGDPCEGVCGRNAECRVDKFSHKAICSCPRGYTGHPFESCEPQKPQDLCSPSPCGTNAQCTPGRDNNGRDRPVCTCLTGYVGNALTHCSRGECQSDAECGPSRTCNNYNCVNPCDRACGVNAQCEVRNHGAVCSCPRGYRGDPFSQCNADPLSIRKKK